MPCAACDDTRDKLVVELRAGQWLDAAQTAVDGVRQMIRSRPAVVRASRR
jgi:hypothetical protein